ncbi:MAG: beta-N-acetylhexosaminidase [Acidobacteria bacterium]|nr:beta-N-acetylhexosaminidase [Acidobacteriota bacterium]
MMRILFSLLVAGALFGQTPATGLWLRGYALIPTPQKVVAADGEVFLDSSWTIAAEGDHIAVRSLRGDLRQFHGLSIRDGNGERVIRLAVRNGAVDTGKDVAIHPQGYRLQITDREVAITGNGDAGLLYGVQTFLQLLKPVNGRLQLPLVSIEDWPRLQLRFLHWDTKHHQDRMATLKRYLDWAVRFKVNMIGFELEDKFAYPSVPGAGAPGAFTPAELQEIVNYGLERFIQVVPVIQSPAHMSYVLKNPRYAHLRADGNNYQICMCDEESYKLILRMYDDVINATRGVDYFFVSTDEVYYAGLCAKCGRPYNEKNRSLAWAEFAKRAHDHLAAKGRRMLAWLEYPLLDEHLEMIPSDVIDGVIGEASFIPIENRKGMRQLAYVSLQGAEFLFPDHLPLDAELADPAAPNADDPLEFERGLSEGRIRSVHRQLLNGRFWQANPIGVFGAAWGDSGLHNETFWLGWAAAARYGWHPGTPGPEQHTAEFMRVYYGPGAGNMVEIYRMMQRQARGWQRAWDRVVSKARGPGYGNSDGKGIGTTRYDQTLTPPSLPQLPDLDFRPGFASQYRRLLAGVPARSLESDQLIHALQENLGQVSRNHYNLEVMLGLAEFTGHHWRLLTILAEAERSFDRARNAVRQNRPKEAMGHLLAAYNGVGRTEREGETAYRNLVTIFEKSQFPKGRAVDGHAFLQVLDDVKDHWGGRTADLGYMFAAERSIGLTQWRKDLRALIEEFGKRNNVPLQGLTELRLEE